MRACMQVPSEARDGIRTPRIGILETDIGARSWSPENTASSPNN